jgi:hypothetical protein
VGRAQADSSIGPGSDKRDLTAIHPVLHLGAEARSAPGGGIVDRAPPYLRVLGGDTVVAGDGRYPNVIEAITAA